MSVTYCVLSRSCCKSCSLFRLCSLQSKDPDVKMGDNLVRHCSRSRKSCKSCSFSPVCSLRFKDPDVKLSFLFRGGVGK